MIGVFDSGFGGLSVLKEIKKKLPAYAYVYLGDSARAPYGNRPLTTVRRFTREGVEFLFNQGCVLVIVACNTASAEALRALQKEYLKTHPERKVLGVIIPAAEEAVEKTKNKRVGIIGTRGTVTSGTFPKELKKINHSIQVFQQACPLLVPLVERGEHSSSKIIPLLTRYLAPLLRKKIDTLILGCTHYEHLHKDIAMVAGTSVTLISEGAVIARKLSQYLVRHPEVRKKLLRSSKLVFYTTGDLSLFKKLGSEFFGRKVNARKVKVLKLGL